MSELRERRPAGASGSEGDDIFTHDDIDPVREGERQGRLNHLPPETREYFEQRRQQLIEDLQSGKLKLENSGSGISLATRFDIIVIVCCMFVLGVVLYTEYGINIIHVVGNALKNALDPGRPPMTPPP